MLENSPTGKRSHKETRKAVLFMNVIYELEFQIHHTVSFTHISLLFCVRVSFTLVSVCTLPREL